ncbi:MAG: aminoacyl-tRNA hydrolase [Bacteroidales bacterium]|nr:aminoacyl-tRNA hydrolase [Bacteroidales bacterium]MDY6001821.1 aminoacyl-tRNA hydrolase [Candidatus Cryptobacteroides sp.]
MGYLVVGLGNIGAEYASTRHNMGFMALDAFANASNAVFSTKRYGDIAETSFKGRKITLLKPSTYMNLSGHAVRYWMNCMALQLENLIVVCDDLNLPFGTIRMRKSGSDGGHNGLKNIEECLGTSEYARIRIGIGDNFKHGEQVDFVLGTLSEEEQSQMPQICSKITEGIRNFTTIGPDRAMNLLNARIKNV